MFNLSFLFRFQPQKETFNKPRNPAVTSPNQLLLNYLIQQQQQLQNQQQQQQQQHQSTNSISPLVAKFNEVKALPNVKTVEEIENELLNQTKKNNQNAFQLSQLNALKNSSNLLNSLQNLNITNSNHGTTFRNLY